MAQPEKTETKSTVEKVEKAASIGSLLLTAALTTLQIVFTLRVPRAGFKPWLKQSKNYHRKQMIK